MADLYGAPPPIEPLRPKSHRVLFWGLSTIIVGPVVTLLLFGNQRLVGWELDTWVFLPWVVLLGLSLGPLVWLAFLARRPRPNVQVEPWWSIVVGVVVGIVTSLICVLCSFGALAGAPGRPLRDGRGRARLPDVLRSRRPGGTLDVSVSGMDAGTRAQLTAEWLEDARMEHASIAAFAELALDLLRVGAPVDLVARAHRAANDEIEHARLCFALASAYAGETIEAAALDVPSDRACRPCDVFARLAVQSTIDGCIGEGAAARVAEQCAARARDPRVREILQIIARDEAVHAELARDIVAYCVATSSHARAEVARSITAYVPPSPLALRSELPLSYGRPSARDRANAERHALGLVLDTFGARASAGGSHSDGAAAAREQDGASAGGSHSDGAAAAREQDGASAGGSHSDGRGAGMGQSPVH